ncbi:FecR family protein [uncultured Chitinophaga sp.]|uniref:FecR family protein n=1 Tax=uncultured Chitinophaga sp. TaxID=339340 RepID=UPI00260BC784|nr:FecR family protein [uncultured Chitinophaga sp.]
MNPSEAYLRELLAKTQWTDEECRWLLHYLEHTPGTELRAYMLERFRQQGFEAPPQGLADSLLAGIHARIQPAAPPARVVPLFRRWRYIAAAVAVGGIIAAAFFLLQPGQRPQTGTPLAAAAPADIAPGSNKARLVLGNGQAVVLDQAADGPLAAASGEQVKKQDAELIYSQGGSGHNTLITPNGGQYRVTLADGTKVWLNAASSLQYPASFDGNDRTVSLSGEAYFEVSSDATRPFFVKVGDMTVQVLGTHFNINAYSEEKLFTTTLVQGAVRVISGSQRITLAPGEQSTMEQSSGRLQRASGEAEDAIGWKNGLFAFKNDELKAVMRDISRWYDVEVVYEKGLDENIHVSGAMRRQEYLAQSLKILELTADVHFEIQGRTVSVRKK